jgi:hypothetical protein
MRAALIAVLLAALAGCQTVPDVDNARYEKIQREVDAYYRCGEHRAYGMATTALRPRDIATAAKGACKRKRHRVITAIQRCYDSAIWSRLTIDIDEAFRHRAIAVVIDRREAIRNGQLSY